MRTNAYSLASAVPGSVRNLTFHPLLMLYGNSGESTFPLFLIMGREPNDSNPVREDVGRYNFDGSQKKRRSSFWNMSYKLVGELNGIEVLTSRELKDQCRKYRTSPIAFADVSPRSIPSPRSGKRQIRTGLPDEEFQSHFERLLSSDAMKRVELILLSGSNRDGLTNQRNAFKERCDMKGIKCLEVPFLFGNNYRTIRKTVEGDSEALSLLHSICEQWSNSQKSN